MHYLVVYDIYDNWQMMSEQYYLCFCLRMMFPMAPFFLQYKTTAPVDYCIWFEDKEG